MSRVGKKPIAIPNGVKLEQSGRTFKATGPKGTLQLDVHPDIDVQVKDDGTEVTLVNPQPDDRARRALHGTMRALMNNMLVGVGQGFQREMKIFGTGYNLKVQGTKLVLQVGFCHPIELEIPQGIQVDIKTPATKGNEVPAIFTLSGADKHVLGQFAANVRRVRPPEPYQGKGIRYSDEHVIRKEGKAFASGG